MGAVLAIIETLKVIDDEEIELLFVTSQGPCIIKPVYSGRFAYVIAGVVR